MTTLTDNQIKSLNAIQADKNGYVYGINFVDGIRLNCHDILNCLAANESEKAEKASNAILDLMSNGIRYSNEDFDILSYAVSVCQGKA